MKRIESQFKTVTLKQVVAKIEELAKKEGFEIYPQPNAKKVYCIKDGSQKDLKKSAAKIMKGSAAITLDDVANGVKPFSFSAAFLAETKTDAKGFSITVR